MNVKQKLCLAIGITIAVILVIATIPAGGNGVTEEISTTEKATEVIAEIATTTKQEETTETELKSLGVYRLTAYCPCEKCCGKWANNRPTDKEGNTIVYGAAGKKLVTGCSVAVDPSVIPYGTRLTIDGKEYIAQDSGGAVKDKIIDLYFNNHEEAEKFGVQYMEVFVYEGEIS